MLIRDSIKEWTTTILLFGLPNILLNFITITIVRGEYIRPIVLVQWLAVTAPISLLVNLAFIMMAIIAIRRPPLSYMCRWVLLLITLACPVIELSLLIYLLLKDVAITKIQTMAILAGGDNSCAWTAIALVGIFPSIFANLIGTFMVIVNLEPISPLTPWLTITAPTSVITNIILLVMILCAINQVGSQRAQLISFIYLVMYIGLQVSFGISGIGLMALHGLDSGNIASLSMTITIARCLTLVSLLLIAMLGDIPHVYC